MEQSATQDAERELRSLAGGTPSLDVAAERLGLSHGEPVRVEPDHGWQRGGGETYILPFRLSSVAEAGFSRHLMLKACIKMFPEKRIGEWITRRHVFEAVGLKTPRLHGWGNGVLLEEYVPYALDDLLKNGGVLADDLRDKAVSYVDKIASLGFHPVALLHNLRSSGDDVVNVDFGEDLGAPQERDSAWASKSDVRALFAREMTTLLGNMRVRPGPQAIAGNRTIVPV